MTFVPLSDCAITATGDGDAEIDAVALADELRRAPLAGVVDVVAAFDAVTVFYRVEEMPVEDLPAYGSLCRWIGQVAERGASAQRRQHQVHEIIVEYGAENGPDLQRVAQLSGLTPAQIVTLHSEAVFTVAAVGFLPGFGYLAGLPAELRVPRLPTPRLRVPAGSVAIAGDFSGVYPLETPGGWNIIGRTMLKMFEPTLPHAARLAVGDKVRFRPAGRSD